MPGLAGLQATACIREKERASGGHVPIVAMTAQAAESDRMRCLESGMDAYVTKPVHVPALLRMIESIGAGGNSMKIELAGEGTPVETQLRQLDESLALSRVGGDVDLLKEVIGVVSRRLSRHVREDQDGRGCQGCHGARTAGPQSEGFRIHLRRKPRV